MLDTMIIRPGTTADLESFSNHWLAMLEEAGGLFESDLLPDWRDRFAAYFRRRMETGEAAFFVAEIGRDIVATAGAILRDDHPVAIKAPRYGYIFGVRVAPAFRCRGLAERLTRDAIAFLQRAGCRKIRLHASQFGRKIYERLGFVPTNEMQLAMRNEP